MLGHFQVKWLQTLQHWCERNAMNAMPSKTSSLLLFSPASHSYESFVLTLIAVESYWLEPRLDGSMDCAEELVIESSVNASDADSQQCTTSDWAEDDQWLIVSKRDSKSRLLPPRMVFVGRQDCDICVPSTTVDMRHAVLFFNYRYFHVKDLNSAYGVGFDSLPILAFVQLLMTLTLFRHMWTTNEYLVNVTSDLNTQTAWDSDSDPTSSSSKR